MKLDLMLPSRLTNDSKIRNRDIILITLCSETTETFETAIVMVGCLSITLSRKQLLI